MSESGKTEHRTDAVNCLGRNSSLLKVSGMQHIEEKSIIIKSALMQNEELDDLEKIPVYNAIEETFGGK